MEFIIIKAIKDDLKVVELGVTPTELEDLKAGRAAVVDSMVIVADNNGDLTAKQWSWDSDDLMVID